MVTRKGPGVLDGVLERLFRTGLGDLWEVAKEHLPKCALCGDTAILRCRACGAFICAKDGFTSPMPVQAVCKRCMRGAFPWVEVGGGARASSEYEEWPYAEEPWAVLGVAENATEAEVKSAFRDLSKRVHPDHGGTAELQAKVNAAYQLMMSSMREAGS